MKRLSEGLLFVLLLIGAMPAHAYCAVSTTGVNFGAYNPLIGGNIDSTGSVTFWCFLDSNHSYSIGLSGGQSGNPNARWMSNTTAGLFNEHIPYSLSKSNANGGCSYSSNWGQNGGERVGGTISSGFFVQRVHTVCGRATGGLDVAVGLYSDTVTVDVNF